MDQYYYAATIFINQWLHVGSLTSTRDKANSQYISEVQTSPYKPVLWG